MNITREKLLNELNQALDLKSFSLNDYCPNGLQIQGEDTIEHIVTGVTASLALIEAAIELNAQAIIVHHGYFWKGEDTTITGYKYQRIAKLIKHNINLFAYHLPLDIHPILGNNAQLAKLMQWNITHKSGGKPSQELLSYSRLATPIHIEVLKQSLTEKLGQSPIHIAVENKLIQTIAWCTGAAQKFIEEAAKHKADVYISGEISEQTVWLARELNIHYIANGHYVTERYGIKALGEYIAEKNAIKHSFVELDNMI